MCTIGTVFTGGPLSQKGRINSFKQCDLTKQTTFYPPKLRQQTSQILYFAFTRESVDGIWAGINDHGVSFVAADAYTNTQYTVPPEENSRLFQKYEDSIAQNTTAAGAIAMLEQFYLDGFPGPDIVLLTDPEGAIFLEFSPTDGIRTIRVPDIFFSSTNHFRILPDAIDYEENHSTYLRLARAEAILEKDPMNGIKTVLKDQHYGQSELSICRIAQQPVEYYTQATVIFSVSPVGISSQYIINGNPRSKDYTTQQFFDAPQP